MDDGPVAQVPGKARVKGQDVEATVLAMPTTLPGVPATPGQGWAVLLFPDGEAKYYDRTAIEVTEWRPA